MKQNIYRKGAVGALLDEYERALNDLIITIADISNEELISPIAPNSPDPNCKSIHTVLAHVIRSGYAYANYIRFFFSKKKSDFPENILRQTVNEFQNDLVSVFKFTTDTFKNIGDDQIESSDHHNKIITSWGQAYDIEQITEHAIVHILRHRRQIEKFKIILRG